MNARIIKVLLLIDPLRSILNIESDNVGLRASIKTIEYLCNAIKYTGLRSERGLRSTHKGNIH